MKFLVNVCVCLVIVMCGGISSARALDLSFDAEGTHLVGTLDDGSSWSRRVVLRDDRVEGKPPADVHMLAHDGAVYVCTKYSMLKLDAARGDVLWRDSLYGRCDALIATEGKLTVRVAFDHSSDLKQSYEVTAERVERPDLSFSNAHGLALASYFRLAVDDFDALKARKMLSARMIEALDSQEYVVLSPIPAEREQLDVVLAYLEAAYAADASNLYYPAYIARLHRLVGDESAYRATIARVLATPARYRVDLTWFAKFLSPMAPDDPVMQQTFDVAFAEGLRRGYEPLANMSLVSVVLFLNTPGKLVGEPVYDRLRADSDPQALRQLSGAHMERVWHFAPRVEMGSTGYGGLAESYEAAGDHKAAATWASRQEFAADSGLMGLSPDVLSRAGHSAYVLLACGLVFWLLLCVKLARVVFDRVPAGTPGHVRYMLLNRLTRAELVGFLILPCLTFYAWDIAVDSVLAIQESANLNEAVTVGRYEHPVLLQEPVSLTSAAHFRFERAYALQRLGEFEQSRVWYESLRDEDERAVHNLGVLARQQGDEAQAKKLLTRSLEHASTRDFARYNLKREGGTPRIDDQLAMAPGVPLIIAPSARDVHARLLAPLDGGSLPIWTSPGPVNDFVVPEAALIRSMPFLLLQLLVCVAMCHALIWRIPAQSIVRSRVGRLGWALCSVIPGGSRHWGVFGPLLCVLWVTSMIAMFVFTQLSDEVSTNIMALIAMPAYSKFFGLSTSTPQSSEDVMWLSYARMWWVFLVVNLIFVAIMERVRPDPHGPFYREASKTS